MSAHAIRSAFLWLFMMDFWWRRCSLGVHKGPSQNGFVSYFQYISRRRNIQKGITESSGFSAFLVTAMRPFRKRSSPGNVKSSSMIASAPAAYPRTTHSNAIAPPKNQEISLRQKKTHRRNLDYRSLRPSQRLNNHRLRIGVEARLLSPRGSASPNLSHSPNPSFLHGERECLLRKEEENLAPIYTRTGGEGNLATYYPLNCLN